MANLTEIMQLCRLCLVKDKVNTPIFEGQGDIRQVFLKISACLPVKISREDKLPKKICDECSYKLELLYQFWNTSANSEKQLLKWLNQLGNEKVSVVPTQSHSINADGVVLKQEVIELADGQTVDELTPDDLNVPNDTHEYILQQQQLPYQTVAGFQFQQDGFGEDEEEEEATENIAGPSATITNSEALAETAVPRRKRRAAAMKALPPNLDSEEEDDVDMVETKIAKTEEQSDDESGCEDPVSTAFVGLPSDNADDNEQPGPSGVGKGTMEAPDTKMMKGHYARFGDLLSSDKTDWSNRLPEIDIIPVLKEEAPSSEEDDLPTFNNAHKRLYQKPARKHKKLRKLTDLGYKNPFDYSKCNVSGKSCEINRQTDSVSSKWVCMICNEATSNKKNLIEHYERHKNEKECNSERLQHQNVEDYFKCVICTREFTSSKSYEKHLQFKHGENNYTCQICNKMYKNSFQLCVHNYNAHPENGRYKCVVCDFSTLHRASLKVHIQKHENDYRYSCEVCDKKFLTATWFEEHKNSHTGAMPFQCEVCTKSFPYGRYLIAHKKSMHPEIYSGVPSVNECTVCKKHFAHRKSLILHVRSHTGENTVLCDMCGKSLSSTEHLKQHLRIHTGYKPHVCNVCGKGFAKKSNLTLHERVHSGEKPYVCKECGKCFSQRSTLVIHERYHSGERPYSCPLCQKGFVAKGLLGVHLKSCSRLPQ